MMSQTSAILNKWRDWRHLRSNYPGQGRFAGVIYCALGLGEAGECIGEIKKAWRDDGLFLEHFTILSEERLAKIKLEMGDILWYLDSLCDELNTSLEEIALLNQEKIEKREKAKIESNHSASIDSCRTISSNSSRY